MNYNEQLYEKVKSELDEYTRRLSEQPVSEIMRHADQLCLRQDIVLAMQYYDLPEAHARALLRTKSPLEAICRRFNSRKNNYLAELESCVADCAGKALRKSREAGR